jgi:hypothetical protein
VRREQRKPSGAAQADTEAFDTRARNDRHPFRFIVSAENARQLGDPRSDTRHLKRHVEADLQQKAGPAATELPRPRQLPEPAKRWTSGPDCCEPELLDALGFEDNDRLLGIVYIGTPRERARNASRPARGGHVREWTGAATV